MAQLKSTTVNGSLTVTGNIITPSGDFNTFANGDSKKYVHNTGNSNIIFKWEDNLVKMWVDNQLMRSFVPSWNDNSRSINVRYEAKIVTGTGLNYIGINPPDNSHELIAAYNGNWNAVQIKIISIVKQPNSNNYVLFLDQTLGSRVNMEIHLYWGRI